MTLSSAEEESDNTEHDTDSIHNGNYDTCEGTDDKKGEDERLLCQRNFKMRCTNSLKKWQLEKHLSH